MNTDEMRRFAEEMLKVAMEAGKYAREAQGTVQNDEKDHPLVTDADSEFIQRSRRAKTIIDEHVQEMLLTATEEALQHPIRIDAEEETPLKDVLHTESAPVTLVLDPIDGTLEYLEGKDDWSINVALVTGGTVVFAMLYYPKLETLYLLEDGKSYKCACKDGAIVGREIIVPSLNPSAKKVFCNNRVPEEAVEKLSRDFEVIRDIHGVVKWPDALLGCISGEYRAALFVRPQVRDILLGAMIETMPGGYAVDFAGNKITWPDGGRIPEVVFGFGEFPEEIRRCLAR